MKNVLTPAAQRIRRAIEARRATAIVHELRTILASEDITLVDIGAAGDIQPRWKRISPVLNYIGFEPDERSREELLRQPNSCASFRILPFAVWDKAGEVAFNLCRKPETSSHFVPNFEFLKLFPDSARFEVVNTIAVSAIRLDDARIPKADFVKLDIQGGELAALRGAPKLLATCLGVEAEVEFVPLYVAQPLFGDVCEYLGTHGFQFMDFVRLARWERQAYRGYGQCVFGDALFLKTPEAVIEESVHDTPRVARYIGICVLYNRFDLIDALLLMLERDYGMADAARTFQAAVRPLRTADSRVRRIVHEVSRGVRFFGDYGLHLFH